MSPATASAQPARSAASVDSRLEVGGASVKAYVITTGTVFVLIVAAHIWRAVVEGPALAKDPFFILSTMAAVTLSLWAWRVLKRMARS
jgi:hypothetical protein